MRLIALLLACLPFMALAQTTLKISTLYPPGTDPVKSLKEAAKQIETATNGEVTLKVYPGGVMGDDKTVLRKIKIGQLQGALVSGTGLDLISKDLKDISQPFQFDSIDQVYNQRETMDGVFRDRLAAVNWQSYGPLDGGFSYLMSKDKVPDMSAIREAKLWLPNTSEIQDLSRQMNVDYLVMNIGDVLTGLDTGAVDTLISPPAAAITLNWHSRFNYYTQTPVLYTFGMLVLPDRALRKLDDQQKQAVDEVLQSWAESLDARLRVGNANALEAIGQLLTPQPFSQDDIRAMRIVQR